MGTARAIDRGVLLRVSDMLPMIVPVFGRIPGGLDERLEEDRRATDDIAENPRNDEGGISLLRRLCGDFGRFLVDLLLSPHFDFLGALQNPLVHCVPDTAQVQHAQVQYTLRT